MKNPGGGNPPTGIGVFSTVADGATGATRCQEAVATMEIGA